MTDHEKLAEIEVWTERLDADAIDSMPPEEVANGLELAVASHIPWLLAQLRAASEALTARGIPDDGEPIAERVRNLAAERDAFRANASTWRTTADNYCNTIAERDAEIERLRTTERPEEKTLREAVAGMRANISQDEREGIHGFADVSVALDALHRALWGPSGRLADRTRTCTCGLLVSPESEPHVCGLIVGPFFDDAGGSKAAPGAVLHTTTGGRGVVAALMEKR